MLKKLLLLLLHTNPSHVRTRAASAMISLVIRNREDYIYLAFLPLLATALDPCGTDYLLI